MRIFRKPHAYTPYRMSGIVDALVHDGRLRRGVFGARAAWSAAVIAILALAIGANTRSSVCSTPSSGAKLFVKTLGGSRHFSRRQSTPTPRLIYYGTFAEFVRASTHLRDCPVFGRWRAHARGQRYSRTGLIEQLRPSITRCSASALPRTIHFGRRRSTEREGAAVVVVGHRFGSGCFGGDPRAIGETLKADGMPLHGHRVTPPHFTGLQADAGADFSVPMWY